MFKSLMGIYVPLKARSLGAYFALVLTGGAVIGGTALAAAPLTEYDVTRGEAPEPQESGQWGERLQTLRDVNRDGANEILVGVQGEDIGQRANVGRVYVLNGADRSVLYEVKSPEVPKSGANFGSSVQARAVGDVDRDGTDDFAAGAPGQDVTTDGRSRTQPAPRPTALLQAAATALQVRTAAPGTARRLSSTARPASTSAR